MLQKGPHFFFGSPFIYFGTNDHHEEDCFPFQTDLIFSNEEKIGLFISWFENDDEYLEDEYS